MTLEKDIVKYSKIKEFDVEYTHCPCSVEAFRTSIKIFFKNVEKECGEAKMNLVKFFLSKKEGMKRKFKSERVIVNSCKLCGEPTKNIHCRSCVILSQVRRN